MELQSFTSRNCTELNPDIMMCLTELERRLAKHFDRVEIRGKRSRMVPVLLTPDMIAAMDLLVKNRNECQVHTENVYLFARPVVFSHYRGSDCFRKYANQCGAKYPEALTSTRLRKQVATLSTVLNLKENEMDQLATFLGHDIRVHREFYRLPESTLQLAKVSKLLMAMEKGKLSDLQGKGLDDIDINPDDEVATSDEDSSEETLADLHQHKGSRTETSQDPSNALHSTTLDNMEGSSASATLDSKNISNTQPTNASQQNTALQAGTSRASSKCSNGKQDLLCGAPTQNQLWEFRPCDHVSLTASETCRPQNVHQPISVTATPDSGRSRSEKHQRWICDRTGTLPAHGSSDRGPRQTERLEELQLQPGSRRNHRTCDTLSCFLSSR
ncbi:uncharacterized protein LOC121616862 [Chelmon rostratus]|uniref:uncharacterized protein LOC121616862 n=1 Tax=Chelmon rostratus TaxID=109905 RepID=UPI001BEC1180|nr:uncharacterized protein LOC121616862 [Chelmon rostratus]